MSTSDWATARVSMRMEANTGNISIRRVIRYTNDEVTWTETEIGNSPLSTDDWLWGGAWQTTAAQIFELGVWAANTSGTRKERAQVTLIIDLKAE